MIRIYSHWCGLVIFLQIDKFFYCRLSPNHKVFYYGDCDETATPTIEQLPSKCKYFIMHRNTITASFVVLKLGSSCYPAFSCYFRVYDTEHEMLF